MTLSKLDIYNPSGHIFELDYQYFEFLGAIQTIQLKAAIQELNIDQNFYTIEILSRRREL